MLFSNMINYVRILGMLKQLSLKAFSKDTERF